MTAGKPNSRTGAFVGIGFELIGLLVAGIIAGRYLETEFGVGALVTPGFILLALVVWLVHLVAMLKKFDSPEEK